MQIKNIHIRNFRSIKEADISVQEFNVFVGQNNHGKTNLFEAVDWFFTGPKKGEDIEDIRFGRQGSDDIVVQIEFIGAKDGVQKMKNETNKTKMSGVLNNADSIIVKRSSKDPKKREIQIDGKWLEKLPTGFDSAFNDFLPKFEYIDTRKHFEDVAKYSKTAPVGIMLSAVLTTILENSQQYRDFQSKFEELFGHEKSDVKVELDKLSNRVKFHLEKQFPDCTKVVFEISPPIFEDLLKNFDTSVDDGVETPAAEKGDGMQRALMLAILQAYSEFRRANEDIGKSFLFFIDEAELHLHPTAQRKLKDVLLSLTKNGDQVFINTHSSVLVVDEHPEQKIFRVEKANKITSIIPINEMEKADVIYELLGGSPADLLLPRNFLIVEGKSDCAFLVAVIRRFYSDKPEIQIIQADGDLVQAGRSMNAIIQLFKPLEKSIYKERSIILCDKPRDAGHEDNLHSQYPFLKTNGQVFSLPTHSIEDYYPKKSEWEKDDTAASKMNGHQKLVLAKKAGEGISQQQFETAMPIIFSALKKGWELAFI